jgi:cyanophycin synthetase
MDIFEAHIYGGANYWVPVPAIRIGLSIGESDNRLTSMISGFSEKLSTALPGLREHGCSVGGPGGLFERIREGIDLFHVAEHIALELQILAGHKISYGKVHVDTAPQETYSSIGHIVFAYEEPEVGMAAGKLGTRLLQSLLHPEHDLDFDFAIQLAELIQLAKELRVGIDTRKLKEEAESRDIPVEYLDENRKYPRSGSGSRRRLSLLQLGQGKFQKRIWAPYVSTDSFIAAEVASNKELTSTLLRKAGLPVPRSISVADEESAARAASEIGYPVVVKPLDGSQGRGVGVYLEDEAAVRAHYPLALRETQSGMVLVEKFVVGRHFRILVVGGRFVAAAERLPGHVVGDGSHTLRELVELSNADPTRALKHKARIAFDDRTIALAQKQGYDPEDILPRGVRVPLVLTCNISTGGTSIDCTDDIHPDNLAICEQAAKIIGLDVAGIDLIALDIAQSVQETDGAICEVNGGPGLFVVHSQPFEGKPRDVIRPVIDHLFPPGSPSRVSVIAVTGAAGTKTTSRIIAHILKVVGHQVGLATTDGISIDGVRTVRGDMSGPDAARMVLHNPMIDVAVLETGYKGILCSGLGYDRADVAVITKVSHQRTSVHKTDILPDLRRVNEVVAKATGERGVIVLNADDPGCQGIADNVCGEVIYFSMQLEHEVIAHHLRKGRRALVLRPRSDGETLTVVDESETDMMPAHELSTAGEDPVVINIASALAAAAACVGLGINLDFIRRGLRSFSQGRFA